MDLREFENLTQETYTPGGRTALHDALLRAVTDTEHLLAERDVASETERESGDELMSRISKSVSLSQWLRTAIQ